MDWSMNKVVYVGVGVYVLDPSGSCASPTWQRPVFIVLTHWNTTSRVDRDVPTQAIIKAWLRANQSVSNSYVLSAKQRSRTSNLASFVWRPGLTWPGIELPTPACQANVQPLHYPAAVQEEKRRENGSRLMIGLKLHGVDCDWLKSATWRIV